MGGTEQLGHAVGGVMLDGGRQKANNNDTSSVCGSSRSNRSRR